MDELDAFEVVRLLLSRGHCIVGLANNSDKNVQHNDGNDSCAEQVEAQERGRRWGSRRVHIFLAKTNQISLIHKEDDVKNGLGISHDVEWKAEGAEDQNVK